MRRLQSEAIHHIAVIDNLSTSADGRSRLPKDSSSFHFFYQDINHHALLEARVSEFRPDAIIHLAGMASVVRCEEDPTLSWQTNYHSARFLLDLAIRFDVKRFLFASSAAVYGPVAKERLPIQEVEDKNYCSLYGMQKFFFEENLRRSSNLGEIHGVSLRFFNVYGENQDPHSPYSGVLSLFLHQFARFTSPPITLFGSGEQTRDFVAVEDVVASISLLLRLAHLPEISGHSFNVGTSSPTSLLQVIQILQKISGKKALITHREPRAGDIVHSTCLNKNILSLGADFSVSLEDGLKNLYSRLV